MKRMGLLFCMLFIAINIFAQEKGFLDIPWGLSQSEVIEILKSKNINFSIFSPEAVLADVFIGNRKYNFFFTFKNDKYYQAFSSVKKEAGRNLKNETIDIINEFKKIHKEPYNFHESNNGLVYFNKKYKDWELIIGHNPDSLHPMQVTFKLLE